MLFWFEVGFCPPVPAGRVAAIAADNPFPRFGRLDRADGGNGGSQGKVL